MLSRHRPQLFKSVFFCLFVHLLDCFLFFIYFEIISCPKKRKKSLKKLLHSLDILKSLATKKRSLVKKY